MIGFLPEIARRLLEKINKEIYPETTNFLIRVANGLVEINNWEELALILQELDKEKEMDDIVAKFVVARLNVAKRLKKAYSHAVRASKSESF